MSARSFSVAQWFASSSHGHSGKTPITVDGYRATLQGLPSAYTDNGIATLASEQTDDVRVKAPRIVTNAGIVVSPSKAFSSRELSQALADYAGITLEKPARKNRVTTEAPTNGTPETAVA